MESYAYNEGKMMEGIKNYQGEIGTNPSPRYAPPSERIAASHELLRKIAAVFKTTPEAVLSRCQETHLVRAREIMILILRKEYGYSLTRIGNLVNRHHTTVLYAIQEAEKHYKNHESFRAVVDELSKIKLLIPRDEMGIPI